MSKALEEVHMFYRIQQFYHGLFPRITSKDLLVVQAYLPEKAISLFNAQLPADQRHGLDVALDLLRNNSSYLSLSQKNQLIQAALLHDCGKTLYPLKLWQRVYVVLAAHLPRSIWDYFKSLSHFQSLSRPLELAKEHPEWGAKLSAQAGLEEEVIQLIRFHHKPNSEVGKLLYLADNRH